MTDAELVQKLLDMAGSAGPLVVVAVLAYRWLAKACSTIEDAARATVRGPLVVRIEHVIAGGDKAQILAHVREVLAEADLDVEIKPKPVTGLAARATTTPEAP